MSPGMDPLDALNKARKIVHKASEHVLGPTDPTDLASQWRYNVSQASAKRKLSENAGYSDILNYENRKEQRAEAIARGLPPDATRYEIEEYDEKKEREKGGGSNPGGSGPRTR